MAMVTIGKRFCASIHVCPGNFHLLMPFEGFLLLSIFSFSFFVNVTLFSMLCCLVEGNPNNLGRQIYSHYAFLAH
jgi:hypothetical protein